jgi:hypothetical protein
MITMKAFLIASLLLGCSLAVGQPAAVEDPVLPPDPPPTVTEPGPVEPPLLVTCPVCPEGMVCTPKTTPLPPVDGIKWHPGHYAETQTYGGIPTSVVNDIANVPMIRGVTQRYNWSQLEPSKDKYDFRAIESDLAKLRTHKKYLIALIMDRSWSDPSKEPSNPKNRAHLPAYLGSGIVDHPTYGHNAALWRPEVMERLMKLDEALGKRFDSEPLFEGVRYEEITPGLTVGNPGVPRDYNVNTMIGQWLRFTTATRWHWHRTNVFLNTNTLGGVKGPLEVIKHAWQIGVGVGGPDVLPPGAADYQIAGDRVIQMRPDKSRKDPTHLFIRDYRGEIPIAHSVQTPELGGKEGTFYPKQLADYAITQVGTTHMSWVVAPSTVRVNWSKHILPYLKDKPRQTMQDCPKKYSVGCVS